MLNPKNLTNGQEQHEAFKSNLDNLSIGKEEDHVCF